MKRIFRERKTQFQNCGKAIRESKEEVKKDNSRKERERENISPKLFLFLVLFF